LSRRRKVEDPAELLKDYGFTPKKALKLFVFSLFFSSIGVLILAFWMHVSFYSVARNVFSSLGNTLGLLNSIYVNDTQYKDALVSSEKYPFEIKKKIGPKDLTLSSHQPLVNVKGQKRQLSENIYEIRFIKSKAVSDQL
jgi:hypothetical protein